MPTARATPVSFFCFKVCFRLCWRTMLLKQVPSFFKARRDQLTKKYPTHTFLFPSNLVQYRNSDVAHPFRQESHFYYLSGFDEPESFLVLAQGKMILFVLPKDKEKEMWTGERYGIEGAKQVFGADEVYLIDELDKKLPELLKNSTQVFYRVGMNDILDQRIFAALESLRRSLGRSGKPLLSISDPGLPLGEMRLFKCPEEIESLRKVCQITAQGHKMAMKEIKPGMYEYEAEALVNSIFRKKGCARLGYSSIVAGGENATCLHYQSNNMVLKDGDLLLIDAGGELDYYSADITRTFPIGKKMSSAQAKVYDLVLKSQLEAIGMAKPGAKLPDIHRHACEVLIDGFLSLGILKGNASEILKNTTYKKYYPHNTSHWLGMDVHDVGLYLLENEPRPLAPGMVFTIEPGFYVQPDDKEAPIEFKNIGIRIEDDILITPEGCEVLTKDAPKIRAEIEALRA